MWKNSGIVKVPVLKMKEHPLEDARTADEILYGMEVRIRERASRGWVLAETSYGYQGYVKAGGLEMREWSVRRWQKLPKLQVSAPAADVFEIPGFQHPYFLSLPRGSLVAITEDMGQAGWIHVRMTDGKGAYMRRSHLRRLCRISFPAGEEEEKLRESLVRTALSYLHAPYRWGGKTPQGIDCSGLCSMVYLLHGIAIYRDAKIQEGYPVRAIPVCRAKPGDLLYFPGHMALYLDHLEYIHATGRMGDDGVVISSLNPKAEHYREDLASCILSAGTVF